MLLTCRLKSTLQASNVPVVLHGATPVALQMVTNSLACSVQVLVARAQLGQVL